MSFSPVQNNFTAGEISPRLLGRFDLGKYFNGCKELTNAVVLPHGGATRRVGTKYIGETKNTTDIVRLIPFQFSEDDAYILEFGNYYMRVFRNLGAVLDSSGTAVYEQTTPFADTELADIKFVQTADVIYMCHTNHVPKILTRTDHNAWTFTDFEFIDGPYENLNTDETNKLSVSGKSGTEATGSLTFSGVFGKSATIELTSAVEGSAGNSNQLVLSDPGTTDIPLSVNVTGTVITITLATDSSGAVTSTVQDIVNAINGNSSASALMTASSTGTTSIVVSADSVTLSGGTDNNIAVTATKDTFQSTDVGRWLRIGYINVDTTTIEWGWGKITSFTNAKQVTVEVTEALFKNAPGSPPYSSSIWRLGAFSETTSYPKSVALYQQRIVFAGSADHPQNIWASKPNQFNTFSPTDSDGTVSADNGFSYDISSGQINSINWLVSGKSIIAGTKGSEFNIRPAGYNESIAPENIYAARESNYGSSSVQGVLIGSDILYLQRSGTKLMDMVYDFNVDSFISDEASLLSEHILDSSVTEIAYQQLPDSILWMIKGDNELIGFTYNKHQQVNAWHKHTLGGTVNKIESIAVIPSIDGVEDQLWMVVNRTINGVTKRYIELLDTSFSGVKEESYFLDCGLSYDGTATSTVSGLDHLIGETVSILADGATHPDKTVDATGTITLDRSASKIHVGYSYKSVINPVAFDFIGDFGGTLGRKSRAHSVYVRLYKTLGCKIGPSLTSLERILFRKNSTPMGQSPDLATGDYEVKYPQGYTDDRSVYIVQDQPLPLTVLAVSAHMNLYEA